MIFRSNQNEFISHNEFIYIFIYMDIDGNFLQFFGKLREGSSAKDRMYLRERVENPIGEKMCPRGSKHRR